ncbi:hypothetical protein ACFY1J_24445 [Streptomyces sp. NPDC001406]|uniref:hypothetical protein n=1 Tax=Streptomyces sp. NPDC001406 TaxID=3364572 RepID=UPI0036C91CA5
MRSRGRTLRFTAVSALVVLALTGFTSGRGHGHGHGYHHSGSGGGGGCSSSSQDHDDTSSSTSGGGTYKDDDDYGTSGGGSYRDSDPYDDNDNSDDDYGSGSGTTAPALDDATAKLLSCATPKKPYATVEVTNPNADEGTFAVTITFRDARDAEIISRVEEVGVPANDKATAQVDIRGYDDRAARVDHCDLEAAAPAVS